MFSTSFNSLKNLSDKQNKKKTNNFEQNIIENHPENVENMLMSLSDLKEESNDKSSGNISITYSKILSSFIDIKNEINVDQIIPIKNSKNTELLVQINALQCLFTWKIESKSRNIISFIKNKYGDYNLDISVPEFTFVRWVFLNKY